MAIDTKHPAYINQISNWEMVRDFYTGESAVKAKGEKYLPVPDSIVPDAETDPDRYLRRYNAYKERAIVPMYVRKKVNGNVGLMHTKPPIIKLPAKLEYMRERATIAGESLAMLLRKINASQVSTGRIGLLLDVRADDNTLFIATYEAESIINWDERPAKEGSINSLNLVVLDESGPVRQPDGFTWNDVTQHKVLQLGKLAENEQVAVYKAGTFQANTVFNESEMRDISIRGTKLTQIPFIFINLSDLDPNPTDPLILELAQKCRTIYRGNADYRQSLYMQGQDTLVVKGGIRSGGVDDSEPLRTGAGALIEVGDTGDAKYIGVDSAGLPEQRQALQIDNEEAQADAGQFISSMQGSQRESGVSLGTRLSAQTADLTTIAVTGAAGLERILKIAAIWSGLNPDEVSVKPNTEFIRTQVTGDELVKITSSVKDGLPLSLESVHDILVDNHLTNKTYSEEMEAISKEVASNERAPLVEIPEPKVSPPTEPIVKQ